MILSFLQSYSPPMLLLRWAFLFLDVFLWSTIWAIESAGQLAVERGSGSTGCGRRRVARIFLVRQRFLATKSALARVPVLLKIGRINFFRGF